MENQKELIVLVAAGCIVMLLIIVSIFAFIAVHKKKMLLNKAEMAAIESEKKIEIIKAANEGEERQKIKIAREIHDGVGTTINAVTRSIDKNLKDFKNGKFDPEKLENDLSLLNEAKEVLRNVSHNLIPRSVMNYGLIKALYYHINTIRDLENSSTDFENRTKYDEILPFTKAEELNIFRICLEILNNLLKHSHYKYLKITIEESEGDFLIDFMHDGIGIDNNQVKTLRESSKSVGLNSIFSRALFLEANIDYAIENESASVTLRVPIKS